MLSRTVIRAANAPSIAARRGFHFTRAQLSSPYHYPEGPRSNIPFNPLTKYFGVRYWTTMGTFWVWGYKGKEMLLMGVVAVGFFLPFGIAGK